MTTAGEPPRFTEGDLARILGSTDDICHPPQDTSAHADAQGYQPTRYWQLERMTAALGLNESDVFVDLGCGKGRVVCYIALNRLRKVVGVELRRDLAAVAADNVRRLAPPTPVEIVCRDVADFRSPDGTVFYMFNPFGRRTVEAVAANIRASWEDRPRPIRIVYNNSVHGACLDALDWLDPAGSLGETGIRVWRVRSAAPADRDQNRMTPISRRAR